MAFFLQKLLNLKEVGLGTSVGEIELVDEKDIHPSVILRVADPARTLAPPSGTFGEMVSD